MFPIVQDETLDIFSGMSHARRRQDWDGSHLLELLLNATFSSPLPTAKIHPPKQTAVRMLDELNDPGMSLRVLIDVPLRGPEVAVSSQHLNVTQRTPDRRYLPRRVRDERPPPAVAGTPLEAEVPVPTVEQVDDHLGRGGQRPLGADHVGTGAWDSIRAVLSSSLIGIIRPDLPLLAESWRQMARPISPWESFVMNQLNFDISPPLTRPWPTGGISRGF